MDSIGRTKIVKLIIFFVIINILFFSYKYRESEKNEAYTMQQAYQIAKPVAKKWADDAEVYKIISTDNHDLEEPKNGMNGKRNCWTFLFHSEEKKKQYSFYIMYGEIVDPKEVEAPPYTTIFMDKILDTDEFYLMAVNEGLKGGTEWAYGYHYSLDYIYVDGDETKPVLTMMVRGCLENGNEAYIYFDPYDGKIFLKSEKTGYDETGKAVWKKFYDDMKSETTSITLEQIYEEYNVYHDAAKNYVDPDELAEAIFKGMRGNYFSPYSEIKIYDKEEWERVMTERYGDSWKEWY